MTVAFVIAQTTAPEEYTSLVKKADSLAKKGDYKRSGHAYSMAFKSFGWKGYPSDRYRAARSWALASMPDSAFSNLLKIAIKGNYSNYDYLIHDSDLQSLHNDARWSLLIDKVKENKEKSEINLDQKLISILDSLVMEDQKWRGYLVKLNNAQFDDTLARQTIRQGIRDTDSLNYFYLKDIFSKKGFPNFDLVGQSGSNNFWLLIQHQDSHPEFQEQVLDKMKDEVDKKKASLVDYVYLLDRVKVNTGQLQVYGTQMILNSTHTSYEPRPVVDREKLNERRKSVGLDTIESYTETMNSRYFGLLKKN